MWIVRVALDRPYTFVVLALLILISSPLVILATPTDIFPNINIPVIAVGWTYTGLNPEEMEGRITTVYERVSDHAGRQYPAHRIDHLQRPGDRQDLPAARRQPRHRQRAGDGRFADSAAPAAARHAAAADHQLQRVERADPAAWPVRRRICRSRQLNDIGLNFLRTQLVTVPGAVVPYPYGGKQRQVMINLNPKLLQAKGLSPGRRAERGAAADIWCCRPARRRSRSSNTTCA